MKKLVSIFLALALILSLSITAFAEEVPETQITIENSTGRTYVGYKLMNLSIDLKEDEHHDEVEGCDGTNHIDECYNYAYTIVNNDGIDYFEILQQETLAYGRQDLFGSTERPTDYNLVTEAQILEYPSLPAVFRPTQGCLYCKALFCLRLYSRSRAPCRWSASSKASCPLCQRECHPFLPFPLRLQRGQEST